MAVSVAAACGDDDNNNNGQDAGVDAPDGMGAPTVLGQSVVLDLGVIDPTGALVPMNRGVLFDNRFNVAADAVAPSFEETPGSAFGCKVFEFTPQTLGATHVGVDEGPLQITSSSGPPFPACNWVDGIGYACASAMGATAAGAAIANDGNMMSSTITATGAFTTDDAGRYVVVTDPDNPPNNGAFPIVAATTDTITFGNPAAVDVAANSGNATFIVVAGLGPVPGVADALADDSQITYAFTSGGEGDLGADVSRNLTIANDFTIDDASATQIGTIPLDGSAFQLSCNGAGGDCGNGIASIVNIQTTDTTIPMMAPFFFFPDPTTKAVQIFCAQPAGSITIPAEASAFLMDSGATRVRAIFGRINQMEFIQGSVDVLLAGGHALAGFTTAQ